MVHFHFQLFLQRLILSEPNLALLGTHIETLRHCSPDFPIHFLVSFTIRFDFVQSI
jgi:hypothetical protein